MKVFINELLISMIRIEAADSLLHHEHAFFMISIVDGKCACCHRECALEPVNTFMIYVANEPTNRKQGEEQPTNSKDKNI
jgi:hypothetical protein